MPVVTASVVTASWILLSRKYIGATNHEDALGGPSWGTRAQTCSHSVTNVEWGGNLRGVACVLIEYEEYAL